MTVVIPEHTSKYKQLAEELQGTVSHYIPKIFFEWTIFLTERYIYSH